MIRAIIAARVAAVVMLALAAAGCSSTHTSTATDFKSGYQAVERDYRTQFTALQTEAQGVLGKDLTTQLTVFTKMTGATNKAVDGLRKLAPPANVKALYERLVVSLSSQEDTLRQIQTSARANDQAALNSSLSGYASALEDGISLLHQIDDVLGSKTS